MDIVLRRPDPARLDEEADAAMAVQRTTLQATLPGLPHPHTEEEDRAWMRDNFARCSVWLAVDGDRIVGVATRSGALVRQLYVATDRTRAGIGQRLLDAMLAEAVAESILTVDLWTFQRNAGARRFYERNGFVAMEFTHGASNEEREPDVRYRRSMRAGAAGGRRGSRSPRPLRTDVGGG
jgi:GNAT superfamily N-acetyltransferase